MKELNINFTHKILTTWTLTLWQEIHIEKPTKNINDKHSIGASRSLFTTTLASDKEGIVIYESVKIYNKGDK